MYVIEERWNSVQWIENHNKGCQFDHQSLEGRPQIEGSVP